MIMSRDRTRVGDVRSYHGKVDSTWTVDLIFALEALIDDVHAKERSFFQDYHASMREFVQKGETNHSELFATRQEQIQAKLDSRLQRVSATAEKGNAQTKYQDDHDLQEHLSAEAGAEVNNARDQNRQLQVGGRFLAIRNAINECAKLEEASMNGISTKINNIQESTSNPEIVREEIKSLLTNLNKSTQNLLDYMHSLEKLKMFLPESSPERLYAAQCERDIRDIYIRLHQNVARLYANPNVLPQHKELILKTQEQIETSWLTQKINSYRDGVQTLEKSIEACAAELKSVKSNRENDNDFLARDTREVKEKELVARMARLEYELESMRISGAQIVSLRHLYDGFVDDKGLRDQFNHFTRLDPLPKLTIKFENLKNELGVQSKFTPVIATDSPSIVVYADAKAELRERKAASSGARAAGAQIDKENERNKEAQQAELAMQEGRKAVTAVSGNGDMHKRDHLLAAKMMLANAEKISSKDISEIKAKQTSLNIVISDIQAKPHLRSKIEANSKEKRRLDAHLKLLEIGKAKMIEALNKIQKLDAEAQVKDVDLLKKQRDIVKGLLKSNEIKNGSSNVLKELKALDKQLNKDIQKLSPNLFLRLFGKKSTNKDEQQPSSVVKKGP